MSEWTHKDGVDGIKKQAQELIEQAYQRGYKASKEDCAEAVAQLRENYLSDGMAQGRNEAWETIIKITKMTWPERQKALESKYSVLFDMLSSISASEAIEKIRAYEEQKKETDEEIKVGDEVVTIEGGKGVVTGIRNNDVFLFIPGCNIPQFTNKICCTKTGRSFPEFVEALKKIEEDKE